MKERSRRVPVRMGCWIESEDVVSCVTLINITDTGISVICSDPLPEGRIVVIKIFTPFAAEAVALRGEVMWSRTEPDGGMGLKFLDMDEKTGGILKSMVRLLRTGKNNPA